MFNKKPLGISLGVHAAVVGALVLSSLLNAFKPDVQPQHIIEMVNISDMPSAAPGPVSPKPGPAAPSGPADLPKLKVPEPPPPAPSEPEPPEESVPEPPKPTPPKPEPVKPKPDPVKPVEPPKETRPKEDEPDSEIKTGKKDDKKKPDKKKDDKPKVETSGKADNKSDAKPSDAPPAKKSFADWAKTRGNPTTPKTQPSTKQGSGPPSPRPPSFNSGAFEKNISDAVGKITVVGGGGGGGGKANTNVMAAYSQSIRDRVERLWDKPNMRGQAKVRIHVAKDGTVTAELAQSSGYDALDESVLKAVRELRRLSPPPGGEAVTFELPFIIRD